MLPSGDANGVSGNVLIRQRTNDHTQGGDLANDMASDGSVIFTLTSGPGFYWLGASAVDDGTFTFLVDISGTETTLGSISGLADSETAKLMFTERSSLIEEGDQFIVHFRGSGACGFAGV